ncbi:nitrate ABC transporter permease [Piscinibacter koreensis]|uniref:Nitrate ABC transporter permease n=1 Tax=Piscinibacter koreensis TaxID=2742824 RepID=A0A7Y6NR93_9BURK|nr:nitrate ABC transporter permease [Schlegelella koreensis]NUZ07868.1 nitrate ABC transporter permease [Schlegelella koreensis]
MVSAVFHTSLDTRRAAPAMPVAAAHAVGAGAAVPAKARVRAAAAASANPRIDGRAIAMKVLPPIVGCALLIAIWAVLTRNSTSFPTPWSTFDEAVKVFSDPFYRNGPNDQGIGWNILFSLYRVAIGFGLAAAVGIPLGFAIGRFEVIRNMTSPLISLLRPVSPLAWLPIGLLVFKSANPAAIWTIFICSIWPMIINTAVGVQRVPVDYLNVARVLNLSEWKVITRILLPAVLPYMLTGVRLSVGTAWLVIVAAEMLTGGVGIGFWVWDEWNNLNVQHILIAIFVIGVVGLLLEWALVWTAKRFSYDGA